MKKLLFNIFFLIFVSPLWSQSESSTSVVKNWAHESEASVVLVGGNSETQTYSAKQKTSYEIAPHKITLIGHYLMSRSDTKVSAENWSAGLRYDYAFSEQLGLFLGEVVSGDRFRGISEQYDTDAGLKYSFWKLNDKDYASSELGYRYTHTQLSNTIYNDDTHYLRAYLEASKSISESVLAKAWIEYLPNLEETKKYLINFEPSLQFTLSQIFSVKTGVSGRYDSLPAATEKFDYTYTLALIAKY